VDQYCDDFFAKQDVHEAWQQIQKLDKQKESVHGQLMEALTHHYSDFEEAADIINTMKDHILHLKDLMRNSQETLTEVRYQRIQVKRLYDYGAPLIVQPNGIVQHHGYFFQILRLGSALDCRNAGQTLCGIRIAFTKRIGQDGRVL